MSDKRCTKCGFLYPLDAFLADKRRPDGHETVCLSCCAKRPSMRRKRGAEKMRAQKRRLCEVCGGPVREGKSTECWPCRRKRRHSPAVVGNDAR